MKSTYGRAFWNADVVTGIDLSGVNRKIYLNLLREKTSGYSLRTPFEIADRYVYKIYELCQERGVDFYLYPCPVSETKRGEVDGLTLEFSKSKIYEINPKFLEMVYYYPAEQAGDSIHFSGDYANQQYFNEIIREMFTGERLWEVLNFE